MNLGEKFLQFEVKYSGTSSRRKKLIFAKINFLFISEEVLFNLRNRRVTVYVFPLHFEKFANAHKLEE